MCLTKKNCHVIVLFAYGKKVPPTHRNITTAAKGVARLISFGIERATDENVSASFSSFCCVGHGSAGSCTQSLTCLVSESRLNTPEAIIFSSCGFRIIRSKSPFFQAVSHLGPGLLILMKSF